MHSFVNTLVAWGPAGVFCIAAIDSAGVPLPAVIDALVVFLSARNPALAALYAALAAVGSAGGTMVLFYIARKGGELYLDKHTGRGRGATLRRWFLDYGLLTVFIPTAIPFPMPVKVPVICAGGLGVNPVSFLMVMVAARALRYGGLAYLGTELGEDAWGYVKSHGWHLGGVAAGLFVISYLLIKLHGRRRSDFSTS